MKKLLVALLLLLAPGFAAAAASVVQTKTYAGGGQAAHSLTFDSPTTSGNAIVVQFHAYEEDESRNISVSSVADNSGSTYSVLSAAGGTHNNGDVQNIWIMRTYTAPNITGRSGHQVTVTCSENCGVQIVITEVSGAHLTTPQAGGGFSHNVSGQPSGSSVTPSADGIHLAMVASLGDPLVTSWSPGSGWTEVVDFNDSAFVSSTLITRSATSGVGQTASATGSQTSDYWMISHAVIAEGVGGSAPTLSSATPSGTLDTSTTATVGATSTSSTGTFYAVLSTSNNVSTAICTQIKAGNHSGGSAAAFANNAAVSTTSPSVGFTGLSAGTLYYYAACHADSNGDSNVVSGSFTTAAADIVATKLIFGSQPGNVIVGQTFGAFTVRAVDDDNALDESFDGSVTITLQTGGGSLSGTTTRAAVGGIATFDDISINTLNTAAVIRASADGLTYADSAPFDVTAGGSGAAGFPSSSRLGGVLQ